jgi:hypothetical protein
MSERVLAADDDPETVSTITRVLDALVPVIDGFQTIEVLRSSGGRAEIPAILALHLIESGGKPRRCPKSPESHFTFCSQVVARFSAVLPVLNGACALSWPRLRAVPRREAAARGRDRALLRFREGFPKAFL